MEKVTPSAPLPLSEQDRAALTKLEEDMWREHTRFDMQFMEQVLASDFFEFGRSGRTYTRAQSLAIPREPIDVALPLTGLRIRLLSPDVAQVTYDTAVTHDGIVEHGRRSSIWSRAFAGWVMRFHQGTPFTPPARGDAI